MARAIEAIVNSVPAMRCPPFLSAAWLVCVLVLGMTATAARSADAGFSGLDPSTLQRLQQADQRPPVSPKEPAASAQSPDEAEQRMPTISSSEAARIARDREGGQVLNVRLAQGAAGPYYRVKILKQGQVRIVTVDARP